MDEWDRRIQEYVDRATPAQRRVWEDFKRRQEPALQRRLLWVRQLGVLATEIDEHAQQSDWRTLDLFWIRLVGTLDELGADYAKQMAFLGHPPASEGTLMWWLRTLYDSMVSILRPLTDAEVIVVDWLRQRASHPKESGSVLQYNQENDTAEQQRRMKILGNRTFTIDQTDAAHDEVLQAHGGDDVMMQVALARRMLPAINSFVWVHERSLGQ